MSITKSADKHGGYDIDKIISPIFHGKDCEKTKFILFLDLY